MLKEYADIQAAEDPGKALQIGGNALYALLGSGKLKGYRSGRVWRIPKESVRQFILDQAGLKK